MKKIKICDKEYGIECNALTYIQYRKKFNRGFLEDLQIIKNFLNLQVATSIKIREENKDISEVELLEKVSNETIKYADNFVEVITRMAYIMILSENSDIEEYEEWLKKLEYLKISDDWIAEVTELAVDRFC